MFGNDSSSPDYWSTAKEPWPSLLFILPFLVVYEIGIHVHHSQMLSRNGADLWIRMLSVELGFAVEWAFPLLAPILLIAWQLAARRPWAWSYETLIGMFSESLIYSMALIVIGQLVATAFTGAMAVCQMGSIARSVAFLGAGIYEEMLFRLTLIPVIAVGLKLLLVPQRSAIVLAVVSSSLIFALAHYVNSLNVIDPVELSRAFTLVSQTPELWFSFTFRLLAGLVFAVLFLIRGFGIAVGSHVLYDLAVGVVLRDFQT